eukprot:5366202-Amphidinium_carterae.1
MKNAQTAGPHFGVQTTLLFLHRRDKRLRHEDMHILCAENLQNRDSSSRSAWPRFDLMADATVFCLSHATIHPYGFLQKHLAREESKIKRNTECSCQVLAVQQPLILRFRH